MITAALIAMVLLAGLPLAVALTNLAMFKAPSGTASHRLSVLIPARNEEGNISAALRAVLANDHPDFEVIVLDDHSTDRTAAIVNQYAAGDERLRLEQAPDLPGGWCGKPHACHVLAGHAKGSLLVFVDADVRIAADALARIDGFMSERPDIALSSGIPRQITDSFMEALVVPMINFLLLGYLPLWVMRAEPHDPSLAAGCGQLMVVRPDAYRAAGGHAAIRTTMHDGLKLPRLLRKAGYATDLFDGTAIAECRMYHGAGQVWLGFSKNAGEGMATWKALPLWTLILGGGHVLPFIVAGVNFEMLPLLACAASWAGRILIARRTKEPFGRTLWHPLGVLVTLVLQWSALLRGPKRFASWRGRTYSQG